MLTISVLIDLMVPNFAIDYYVTNTVSVGVSLLVGPLYDRGWWSGTCTCISSLNLSLLRNVFPGSGYAESFISLTS
jgi:hypothetical protein